MESRDPVLSLREAIKSAISKYESTHPRRARSVRRSANIADINKILQTANTCEGLLTNLEDYFAHESYYTGIRDKSALEDFIAHAIITHNDATGGNLNTFGYSPTNHPNSNQAPVGALDTACQIDYELNDFIQYAISKYIGERHGKILPYRNEEIERIKEIMSDKSNVDERYRKLRDVMNSLTHSCNSHFKQYLKNALENYAAHVPRQFHIRTWMPEINPPTHKIMIYLHGWHDSVNSANVLAAEAVKEGCKVIAYDHRGHGKDKGNNQRQISTDLLRIDFRKFLEHIITQHPDAQITLVGHSMGGAILASEYSFIEKNTSVNNVSLLAPAVMSSAANMLSPAKLICRNMHKDVLGAQRASDRFGGRGPGLFSLLRLMRKAADSLKHLLTNSMRSSIKWNIYSGKKDASVMLLSLKHCPK